MNTAMMAEMNCANGHRRVMIRGLVGQPCGSDMLAGREVNKCAETLFEIKPPEPEGLFRKYIVYKADGITPVPGEDVFVLRPGKDTVARKALAVYANTTDNLKLRDDLRAWVARLEGESTFDPEKIPF